PGRTWPSCRRTASAPPRRAYARTRRPPPERLRRSRAQSFDGVREQVLVLARVDQCRAPAELTGGERWRLRFGLHALVPSRHRRAAQLDLDRLHALAPDRLRELGGVTGRDPVGSHHAGHARRRLATLGFDEVVGQRVPIGHVRIVVGDDLLLLVADNYPDM